MSLEYKFDKKFTAFVSKAESQNRRFRVLHIEQKHQRWHKSYAVVWVANAETGNSTIGEKKAAICIRNDKVNEPFLKALKENMVFTFKFATVNQRPRYVFSVVE